MIKDDMNNKVPTYYSNIVEFFTSDTDTCLVFGLITPEKDTKGKVIIETEKQVKIFLSNEYLERFLNVMNENREIKKTKQ